MGFMERLRTARRGLGLLAGLGALAYLGCSDDDPVVEATPPGPPAVTTEPVSEVGSTTARFNARVFPNGAPTTVYFDLGSDISYGATSDSVDVVAGWDTVAVHVDVADLTPTTLYHCRASAVNAAGASEGEDKGFITLTPNVLPETQVTATPPVLTQTPHVVAFFWAGLDTDGEVTGFEWRISDNGADGAVDVADTLGLDWHWTTVTDSTFVVTADLDAFPAEPSLSWQTHTFFIRAVDDRNERDVSPASVSFTATTEPPEILITSHGGSSTTCVDMTVGTEIVWTADDPDAFDESPVEVRWILIESSPPGGGNCWSQGEFETVDPFAGVASDDPRWSGWLPYPQTSGMSLPSLPPGTAALLGVQARDVAGSITPGYEWNVNVLALRAIAALAPPGPRP